MEAQRKHPETQTTADVVVLHPETKAGPPRITLEGSERIGDATINSRLEIPEEVWDRVPLAIAPGYLGDQWAYQGLSNFVLSQGKPVLTWKFPRKLGVRGSLNPTHTLYPQKLAGQAIYRSIQHMQSRKDIPEDVDVEQFDAVGHSRGGPTIIRTAIKKPDLFRTIIFDSPAGFEDHSPTMMAKRLVPFFTHEVRQTLLARDVHIPVKVALQGLASYILANPLRTAMEAIDVSKENVTEMLSHDHLAGVPKALYGYSSDELIHIDKCIEESGHLVDINKVHDDPAIGHLGPQRRPKEVGKDYLDMIAQLTAIEPDNSSSTNRRYAKAA